MEKALNNQVSSQKMLVKITPDLLREIASRLESSGNLCVPKQYAIVPLTQDISLCYERDVSKFEFLDMDLKKEDESERFTPMFKEE